MGHFLSCRFHNSNLNDLRFSGSFSAKELYNLTLCTLPKRIFVKNLKNVILATFGHFLPPDIYKYGVNDLEFSEKLLLIEFMSIKKFWHLSRCSREQIIYLIVLPSPSQNILKIDFNLKLISFCLRRCPASSAWFWRH